MNCNVLRNVIGYYRNIVLRIVLAVTVTWSVTMALPLRSEAQVVGELLPPVLLLPENSSWVNCGLTLLELAGSEDVQVLETIYLNSVSKDPAFLRKLLAVISVESNFNPRAHSTAEAYGLMQMTEVAVSSATGYCDLRPLRRMELLYEPSTNVRYGSCYLSEVLAISGGDLTRALIFYNGGGKQLSRYDRGDRIVTETANYVLQVRRALTVCTGNRASE
jgi:hypothetical protein